MSDKSVTPIPSATVILIQEVHSEMMVYLMQRSLKARFMPGNYVFPGGIRDISDGEVDFWKPRCDMNDQEITHKLGGDLNLTEAITYSVTAIRETFEEAGALFARTKNRCAIDPDVKTHLRKNQEMADGWFNTIVLQNEWILTLSHLNAWGRWITPLGKKYRYDARYFWAKMPDSEVCRFDEKETINGIWMTPENALKANLSGRIRLSPPTLVTLFELWQLKTIEKIKLRTSNGVWGDTFMPRAIPIYEGEVLIEPWDPSYDDPDLKIDEPLVQKAILPFGSPFSRIWNHNGLARPIGVKG